MSKKKILCLSNHSWYGLWNVPHQVIERLSDRYDILYVHFPISIFQKRDTNHLEFDKKSESLTICNPNLRLIPAYKFPLLIQRCITGLNGHFFRSYINRILDDLGWFDYVTYIYDPRFFPFLKGGDLQKTVYDCIDEWAGYHTGFIARNFAWVDDLACTCSKTVFVGAQHMLKLKKQKNTNTHLIPFGVDVEHFSKAMLPQTVIPIDIVDIPKPIIGLIGVLDSRLDIDLLLEMASSHPEWSIVLIGPFYDDSEADSFNKLKLQNVYFLGGKNISELPGYLKAIDVCIIPYIINQFTKNINPLKLYEYFSAGKPVVSTDIPECRNFVPLVSVTNSSTQFIRFVEEALEEKGKNNSLKRQQIVITRTWDEHVNKKTNHLLNISE